MTEKVLKYRQKHKMCDYCRHLDTRSSDSGICYCTAKKKVISCVCPDMTRVPRFFCQCFEV